MPGTQGKKGRGRNFRTQGWPATLKTMTKGREIGHLLNRQSLPSVLPGDMNHDTTVGGEWKSHHGHTNFPPRETSVTGLEAGSAQEYGSFAHVRFLPWVTFPSSNRSNM